MPATPSWPTCSSPTGASWSSWSPTILAGRGKEHSVELAEAIVASYDGILAAALLKPAPARRAFLERSLGLVLRSLAGD